MTERDSTTSSSSADVSTDRATAERLARWVCERLGVAAKPAATTGYIGEQGPLGGADGAADCPNLAVVRERPELFARLGEGEAVEIPETGETVQYDRDSPMARACRHLVAKYGRKGGGAG